MCSDLISRQAALDAIQQRADRVDSVYSAFWEGLIIAQDIVKNVPSAEPEPKKGKWIKEDLSGYFTPGGNSMYHCSECGHTEGPWPYPRLTNFCPSCGADMR